MFLKKYSAAEFVVYKHVYEAPRSINRHGSCKVCTGGTPPEPTQPRCGVKLGPPPPLHKELWDWRGGNDAWKRAEFAPWGERRGGGGAAPSSFGTRGGLGREFG